MSPRKYVLPAWEGPDSPQTPVPVDERIEAAEAVALQAAHYVRDEVPVLIAQAVADERQRIRQLAIDRHAVYFDPVGADECLFADLLDGAS